MNARYLVLSLNVKTWTILWYLSSYQACLQDFIYRPQLTNINNVYHAMKQKASFQGTRQVQRTLTMKKQHNKSRTTIELSHSKTIELSTCALCGAEMSLNYSCCTKKTCCTNTAMNTRLVNILNQIWAWMTMANIMIIWMQSPPRPNLQLWIGK